MAGSPPATPEISAGRPDHPPPAASSPPRSRSHARPHGVGSAFTHGQRKESDDIATLASLRAASASRPASQSPLWSGKAREANVVRGRQGSVLTRGLILKTDHFEGTRVRPSSLELSLQGAPNFRKAGAPLEVYGVAQPTITGLRTILTVLQAAPPPPAPKRTWARTDSVRAASNIALKSPPLHKSRQASQPHVPTTAEQSDSARDDDSSSPSNAPEAQRQQPVSDAAQSLPSSSSRAEERPRTVWVCTREEPILYIGARPFVLRESASPTVTFSLSSKAEALEAIEERLKQDVLREAAKFGGLIMVHEEEGKGDEPKLRPMWIAVDPDTVKTVKEVFEDLRNQGWCCDYHRVPISQDQPIENNYLDAYTRILRNLDPTKTCVVANCGAGVTRTTFAMVAAQIVRRRQAILMGRPDPFQLSESVSGVASPGGPQSASGTQSPALQTTRRSKADSSMEKSLRATWEKQAQAQALLRLVQLLGAAGAESPVDLLLSSPNLLDGLRRALTGDFSVIRGLCGILDAGIDDKVVVDVAIDAAAHLTNLREAVLLERASYALVGTRTNDATSTVRRSDRAALHLDKAVRALEKYFFLVSFASYVNGLEQADMPDCSFATWLDQRSEIWNTIQRIRSKGKQLYLFDPVADLSNLNRSREAKSGASRGRLGLLAHGSTATEERAAGDEFAEHHVRNLRSGIVLRPGTLLKEDIWQAQKDLPPDASIADLRGTINFRRLPGTAIFATGQPTVEGVRNALASVVAQLRDNEPVTCLWLNLREEPLLYIAGKPYVLRDSTVSLRNIKAYGGISWARLQLLEDRLKADVINELEQNDGRLLLHSENAHGDIYPQWQEVQADDIETLQDVMSKVSREIKTSGSNMSVEVVSASADGLQGVRELDFRRIPFTAEKPPNYEDMTVLLQAVLRAQRSAIINNCQLGRGRSTLASVIVLLIARWLHKHKSDNTAAMEASLLFHEDEEYTANRKGGKAISLTYHLINSLLRVIPHGLEVKKTVDEAIDRAGAVTNLRDSIEEFRLAAEEIDDVESPLRQQRIHSGCQALRRYFVLIIFQSFLTSTKPDLISDLPTFEAFVSRQPVLQTISKEFEKVDISLITPLQTQNQRIEAADGMALASEVDEVVAQRHGAILTAYTMLKSDFFSGIAKVHLSQIEGIPNLRSISLLVGPPDAEPPTPGKLSIDGSQTWGSGMPTIAGLRAGLEKMNAGPHGHTTVVWTSLREEPVVYVRGRPHVLRLADQPLTNLEATGITTETVERQELALKSDVIEEAGRRDGRILLHDEVELEPGKFDIIPVWETIKPSDVLTPREAYELIQSEGYKVDYARVAVTDEQAPLPAVFGAIERRVLKALKQGSATAFNCQMGRGRTTTGMVIASLVSTIHHHRDEILNYDSANASIVVSDDIDDGVPTGRMEGAKDFLDNREDELMLQGEYRIILRLVGLLSHGKLAKRLVDAAIDRMDAVQNLRKAIYDARLRTENSEPGTSKRKHLSAVYDNYLTRYGYLIGFANHLLVAAEGADYPDFGSGGSSVDSHDSSGNIKSTMDVSMAQVKEIFQAEADKKAGRARVPSLSSAAARRTAAAASGLNSAN
ncbi:unnamed protein product [Parajaminaea phylloscopi]